VNAWKEPATANAGFREKHKLTFPVIVDERGQAASLYGILGVPHVVLIDPEGRIRISGSLDASAGALEKLLQEP
jgi:peroxiredoxin